MELELVALIKIRIINSLIVIAITVNIATIVIVAYEMLNFRVWAGLQ